MIGLFFGSFNPVHTGHLIVAEYMRQHAGLQEVWFIVSPQNPLKDERSLLNEAARFTMVKLAIKGNIHFSASDIEFKLARPSFTIYTMEALTKKFPRKKFSLIMGGDNLRIIGQWKDYQLLLDRYPVLIYNRGKVTGQQRKKFKKLVYYDAPHIGISSTQIRGMVAEHKSIRYLVPDSVNRYILKHQLYSKVR